MATILDGKSISSAIVGELKDRIRALAAQGRPAGLTVVVAGDDPASDIYVRSKTRTCRELGMAGGEVRLQATATQAEILARIEALNDDDSVDGILVQMPLPKHIDSRAVLAAVRPDKDVDGFHPYNVGQLVAGVAAPRPCTPAGVMEILRRSGIGIAGKEAVIVGRSDIVGKPMALLLLHAHSTVTVCHSKTRDLPGVCRRADILVAAMGRPAFITADFIRPGAVVIDVGINRIDHRDAVERIFPGNAAKLAAFDKRGSVLVGDVDPAAMAERSSAYTPVPGGVGPLTIAMLMANTVECAERRRGLG